ncbi:MAG: methyltransferase domain-containing protein [Deltaproteobacteria bacterium]|nr:methyltransferase domain-containing protein [Deltaproteobacteria bacterium]
MAYPWHYDESIQVGTDYQDENEVRAYDQRMQRLRNVGREVEEIQRALALSSEATVWEIGTGTGECALALAPRLQQVYATDVSPVMLQYASRKAAHRGIRNISFENGGFLSGFQPDGPVDGVVTQLALHHLPDFWKTQALDAIATRLRPGGRLFLRDVVFPSGIDNYDDFFSKIVDGVRSKAGNDFADKTIQHIRKEFSTLDWILEGMMARSGLKIIQKDYQGFLSVYVCEK